MLPQLALVVKLDSHHASNVKIAGSSPVEGAGSLKMK
jgi:hypothetical protein